MATNIHADLIDSERHAPYRQVFANAAARLADSTTYVVADLYKMAYQSDTNEIYTLTAITPTWTISAGGTGGGETLAQTLALGNVTGTNDMIVSDNDSVNFGTGSDINMTFDAAVYSGSGALKVTGANVTDIATGPGTSAIEYLTGTRTVTDGATGPGSGFASITTGITDSTHASGTGGDSGLILLSTGNAMSTLGTSGDSGHAIFQTGTSADNDSGDITFITGAAASGTSGDVKILVGSGANRGDFDVQAATTTILCDANANGFFLIGPAPTLSTFINADTRITDKVLTLGDTPSTIGETTTTVETSQASIVKQGGANFYRVSSTKARRVLEDNFENLPQITTFTTGVNSNWLLTGVNVVEGDATFTGGALNLAAAGVTADSTSINPPAALNGTDNDVWSGDAAGTAVWNTLHNTVFKIVLITGASIVDTRIQVGFGNPVSSILNDSGGTDQAMVRYDSGGPTSSTNWVLVSSNGGTDTLVDLGVAVAANTVYAIEIHIGLNTARVPAVFINGILVSDGTAALNISSTYLSPRIGVQTNDAGGASRSIRVVKVGLEADLPSV